MVPEVCSTKAMSSCCAKPASAGLASVCGASSVKSPAYFPGIRRTTGIDRAFAAAKAQGVAGVVAVTGAEMFAIRKEIVQAQDKYRIPAVTGSIGYAEMGGLAKLNPDIPLLWRKMAPTIDRLLRGAKASDLPLITLDSSELEINLRTAQMLGVTVPEDVKRRAVRLFQ